MRPTPWTKINPCRVRDRQFASDDGDDFGAFLIKGPNNVDLQVIVSSGTLDPEFPWDHVSVSTLNRCPNWPEMDFIKRLFFADDECAMQLHVPVSDHINNHPYCLHIWRPLNVEIPRPPSIMVGVK